MISRHRIVELLESKNYRKTGQGAGNRYKERLSTGGELMIALGGSVRMVIGDDTRDGAIYVHAPTEDSSVHGDYGVVVANGPYRDVLRSLGVPSSGWMIGIGDALKFEQAWRGVAADALLQRML